MDDRWSKNEKQVRNCWLLSEFNKHCKVYIGNVDLPCSDIVFVWYVQGPESQQKNLKINNNNRTGFLNKKELRSEDS